MAGIMLTTMFLSMWMSNTVKHKQNYCYLIAQLIKNDCFAKIFSGNFCNDGKIRLPLKI